MSITLREMCEVIVAVKFVRNKQTGEYATSWQQIWEYSPTGELAMVYHWYWLAEEILKFKVEEQRRHCVALMCV